MLECKRGALKGLLSVSQKEQGHRCEGFGGQPKDFGVHSENTERVFMEGFFCAERGQV